MSEEEGIRAKLEQIAGGVKLIDAKLDSSNRFNDERHERTQKDILDLRERSQLNANDIQNLHGWKSSMEGERRGFIASGKLLYTLLSLSGCGVAVLLFKAFGA